MSIAKKLIPIILTTFPLLSVAAFSEEKTLLESKSFVNALTTFAEGEYAQELTWWAADARTGREPGTPGSHEAGDRAAREFRRLGLEPVGDVIDGEPSYFQYLDSAGKRGLAPGHRLAVGDREFNLGQDWSLLGGCEEADLKGVKVAFAGYGITAPEYGYDDFEGIDVEGKAVLILRYEPQERDEKSEWEGASNTRHAYFQTKLQNAQKHGAVAVLLVNGPLHHDPDRDSLSDLTRIADRDAKIPMAHVRGNVANELLKAVGFTLRDVQERIDRRAKPASVMLSGTRLDFVGRVDIIGKARNVMGLLKGTDPRLKDEVIVIGAHYDHLGLGAYGSRSRNRRGEIHNGADDNASGSVGVIEMAEAFIEGGLRPRRSILFQLYDAEEKGLIGSRYYVEHPAFPIEKTVAMLNMDMIARVKDSKCSILGTDTAKEWEEILKGAEEGSSIQWNHSGGGGGGSDQASFLRQNIPVLFFFSGMHEEYHTPDDDVQRCNMPGAVDVMTVVLKTAVVLADRKDRLTFVKPASTRRARASFGISARTPKGGKPGLVITRIVKESGAEKAGLLVEDIIIEVDGTPINGLRDLASLLRERTPGDVVKVRYMRGDEENLLEVILGGS